MQLNKGEALHALRRDVFIANEGKIRQRHQEDQLNQAAWTGGREAAKLPHQVFFLDLLFPFCVYTLAVIYYFLLQTMILVKILPDYFRFYPFAEMTMGCALPAGKLPL